MCIAGNLVGRNQGFVTTQGQIVADLFAHDGYEVISVSSKRNRALRIAEIVWTIFRNRRNIDVLIVEVYSGLAIVVADAAGRVARLFGVRSIFVLHGGNLPDFTKLHVNWVKRILNRADLLAAPSRFLEQEMSRYDFAVTVIPNVIDLDNYPYRKRQHISPKLFWMRSFHSLYNPEMALDVFSRIRSEYPTATMVMAGVDKGLEDEIKNKAHARGFGDSIRFPGFLDHEHKIREFSAADVYLNTNRIDNMPISVVEAWAMGVPVVATNVGGLSHLIESGETGLLVDDNDADGMASAVRSLLKDPETTKRLSVQGRSQAELSSWDSVRKKWEHAFEVVARVHEPHTSQNDPVFHP
ncbi:MAG: glycosyltransferase family 4 protein [Acidobacteriota bacterium]